MVGDQPAAAAALQRLHQLGPTGLVAVGVAHQKTLLRPGELPNGLRQ